MLCRATGPEHGPVNYSTTFNDGQGKTLHWQPLSTIPVKQQRGAPVPLPMPPSAAALAANRTVAAVLCTHLFVPAASAAYPSTTGNTTRPRTHGDGPPSTAEVQLTGSTSALAELYVNGVLAVNDRIVTGQLLQEFSTHITLVQGQWNVMCVKAMQPSFAIAWSFALSVHQVGSMARVPGLQDKY